MQTITDNARLEGAYFQAKLALRLGLHKQPHERDRAINRMYDTLDACERPYLTTGLLIRRLGHKKSVVLGLSRPLINLSLRADWPEYIRGKAK
jgi:hypothetical protein